MSLADDLLNDLTEEEIVVRLADEAVEPNIVIGEDRFITVPDELQKIAVRFDHRIETVTFDCPRYWDGADMSKMNIYIHYEREDGLKGMYAAKNVEVDKEDPALMHFDWTLTRNVTGISGDIKFLVSIDKVDRDGNIAQYWSSELNEQMHVSNGMDNAESITDKYADIISQLIQKMDGVELIATPENMEKIVVEYLDKYLATNDEDIKKQIEDDVKAYLDAYSPSIPGQVDTYVDNYIQSNPFLFSVGPNEPTHKCLWFDTSRYGDTKPNVTFNMTDGASGAAIYAETGDGDTVTEFASNDSGVNGITGDVTPANSEPKYNYDIV